MTLGERLSALRALAQISAKDVDRLADITEGHTWALEKSKTSNAELKTLDKVARVYGVTLDYLARGEGDPPTEHSVRAAVALAREVRSQGEHAEPGNEPTGTG